jgi:hypothetical protein
MFFFLFLQYFEGGRPSFGKVCEDLGAVGYRLLEGALEDRTRGHRFNSHLPHRVRPYKKKS